MRKALALFLFFTWPWSAHVEKFTVTIPASGRGVYQFKKKFSKQPACTSNAAGMEWYPDKVFVHGKPGAVVTGSCR